MEPNRKRATIFAVVVVLLAVLTYVDSLNCAVQL